MVNKTITGKRLEPHVSLICSYSPATLAKTFEGDIKRAVTDSISTGADDYLILAPSEKSAMNLISRLLTIPGTGLSIQQDSFTTIKRLCSNITKELAPEKRVISETSAIELLKGIVAAHGDTLAFSKISDTSGLYKDLYRLIIKFKEGRSAPSPGDVPGHKNSARDSFLFIYKKYNEYLNGKGFFDEADEITYACDNLDRSSVTGLTKRLFIAGFVHFSKPEERFITALTKLIRESGIYMLYDDRDKDSPLYSHLNGFVSRISGAVSAELTTIEPDGRSLDDCVGRDLDHVKENIFTSYKEKKSSDPEDDSVMIVSAVSIEEEAAALALRIKSLLSDKTFSSAEIAVVVRDKESYLPAIARAFDEAGINYSFKESERLAGLNIVKTALIPLYLISNNFVRDDLFAFLGSGYIDRKDDIDIEIAELTAISAGIAGGAGNYTERLEKLEQYRSGGESIRAVLSKHIKMITDRIKERDTVTGYKESLRSLLEEVYGIKEMLARGLDSLDPDIIKRGILGYSELFRAFDEAADAYNVAGKRDSKLTASEMIKLITGLISSKSIEAGSAKRHVSGNGPVELFTPEEFFVREYKAVFVPGMNGGTFPKSVRPSFLIGGESDSYDFLVRSDDIIKNERLFFYRIAALCTDKLYLSYIGGNNADRAKSTFIDDVDILTGRRSGDAEHGAYAETSKDFRTKSFTKNFTNIFTKQSLLKEFFSSFSADANDFNKSVFDFLLSLPEERARFKRIFANIAIESRREKEERGEKCSRYEGNILPGDSAGHLKERLTELIEKRTFSASQIDTFANCPLCYLFEKVLYLKDIDRLEPGLKATDKGTILHDILFRYFSTTDIAKKLANLPDSSKKESFIDSECMVMEGISSGYLSESSRLLANIDQKMLDAERKGILNILKSVVRFEINGKYGALEKLSKAEAGYNDAYKKSEKSRLHGRVPKNLTLAEERLNKARRNPFLFEPRYFEFGFGTDKTSDENMTTGEHGESDSTAVKIRLTPESDPDRVEILIRGYIDRIDVNDNTGEFIVVDYKSGASAPSKKSVKEGLNSQLPIYEECVKNTLLKEYKPAYNIYYLLKDTGNKKKVIDVHFKEVRQMLLGYITRMKAGEFCVTTETNCRPFCDFPGICRVRL